MAMNTWTPSPTPSMASPTSSSLSALTPIKRQLGAIEASDSGSVPEPSQTSETASSSGSVSGADVAAALSFYLFGLILFLVIFGPFIGHALGFPLMDHWSTIVAFYTFCVDSGRDPDVLVDLDVDV
jgi:hypothetical protein